MKDLLYLKDEQIKEFIQLLFYAYRETFSGFIGLKTSFLLLREFVKYKLFIKFANWYRVHFV